ncbi:hypothetical protein LZD49_17975 [Dyadobacter sp. CY261]|uniref:hypothetical protein n=1 Tax=Dyadobacter sp. CY261 TaxID=2907203 RepID=UPI001F3499CC|nr:hypothetical protein [Dyadobacter sp. CY261]MCF0072375.1 hypothetical protein [Dyadobacter sp. CY261]
MKQLICIVALGSIVASCDFKSGRIENTKELNREIKASQIKRVTNVQLISSADEWGKKIAQIAEKSLKTELERKPDTGLAHCQDLSGIPVIAALQKEYGVKVQLLGTKDLKNPALDPKEREILDAYAYSAKSNTQAGDNLQQLNDTLLVYNAPVSPGSVICKRCMAGQDTTFAVWRLLFNKKEIIRKLDAKQLKD